MVSWLPTEVPSRPLSELDWWQPNLVADWLGEHPRWGSLSYVVVDELEAGVAGLVVSPWPRVDLRGRLHFGDEEDDRHVTVLAKEFLTVLAARRKPIVAKELDEEEEQELRTRKLAIGDVFAVRVRGRRAQAPEGMLVDPHTWLRDEVLDITAEAREVAKVQTAAAVAGVVDDDFITAVAEELSEDGGA